MRAVKAKTKPSAIPTALPKCPTGIHGLDEITLGGLPRGRPTLVCGAAGCGKTLLGMEFLVRGATEFDEPGVCLSFEESEAELSSNVASLGFDLPSLVKRKKLLIDHVYLERSLIEEAGDYDLEALFVRLGHAVDSIGAKRVLLDSIEALFAGLAKGIALALRTAPPVPLAQGEGPHRHRHRRARRRHAHAPRPEEYISDCVILLDHRVNDTILTRRLRIVKYRGSTHGTNEYPFLIESDGISVLPVTSVDLKHSVSNERVSTGVPALDAMLGGEGYFRGSSILVSGTAGTGKTSLTAQFVDAACARGERCGFFSFEESPNQIIRNMRSIGIDLGRWVTRACCAFMPPGRQHSASKCTWSSSTRPSRTSSPSIVVVDPLTALLHSGTSTETRSMLLRLVDFLKEQTNHGLDDHPDQRLGRPGTNRGSASLPWWMRGCCCAISRAGASATAASTSSRPAALPIRIRFANSF